MITHLRTIVLTVTGVLALMTLSLWTAGAQSIPTILLVSGSGAIGSLDPITEFSINGTTWAPATIVPACCQLGQSLVNYDVIPGTQLIARNINGTTPTTPTTLYRVFFTLPSFYITPVLQIKMHADNTGSVFLNGALVGAQPGGSSPPATNFKDPPSVFIDVNPAHFQPGQNEIRFQVVNIGGPSILDYETKITYMPVPPPAGSNPCANPTILGTPGNDIIAVTGAPQVINGLGGDDAIVTGDFNDIICGGDGDDRIASGKGNDQVFGGNGDDAIDGGDGIDVLLGNPGDDLINGGNGFDVCLGGLGIDTLSGCP